MNKKLFSSVMALVLGGTVLMPTLAACKKPTKDSIVIMTEELSGLFNPFYATSGADMDVIGMTQIGMLSTDRDGNPTAGDNEATVVKSFNYETVGTGDDVQTVYTFVLKNNLTFSDGQPLTMEDVLFNMYVYLDPSYTGSTTMYSTDIVGLQEYRLQKPLVNDNTADEEAANMNNTARAYATSRVNLLKKIFERAMRNQVMVSDATMRQKINEQDFSSQDGYKNAVVPKYEQEGKGNDYYRAQLLADYEYTLETFREELVSDFKAAKESYDLTTAPYKDWANLLSNDIFKFFLYEGYIQPNYAKISGTNRDDKTKIVDFNKAGDPTEYTNNYTTMDAAIDRVFRDKTTTKLNEILDAWGTAGTIKTQYTADALDILLHEQLINNGGSPDDLKIKSIEGIVSLGHDEKFTDDSITLKDYTTGETKQWHIAREYNDDGSVKNGGELGDYEVLQITVNGTDPKAIFNFGFTVAPSHYYGSANGTGSDVNIDIASNKFGVPWASSDFQSKVIQSPQHVEVPVGAGPFAATDAKDSNNPTGAAFWNNDVVYYKANTNFMFTVKAQKLRLQVVSSNNAIGQLETGAVDYITPQFTVDNHDKLTNLAGDGIEMIASWQLGYGYIGINAGKIPDINIRRAIMAAMNVQLACEYYKLGTCIAIRWPMSKVNWAYPKIKNETIEDPVRWDDEDPQKSWTRWEDGKGESTATDTLARYPKAVTKIQGYMDEAGVTDPSSDSRLKITFTIAGASITEHPTYNVFRLAAEILNACGWEVEVKADSQALTKLATGSLEVWAAAWGSTIDPDMYQVYHMDSTATSTYAWGYREIKEGGSSSPDYGDEYALIQELSDLVDQGREKMTQEERKPIYKQALGLVLDLAVEMPVYQRQTLYAYNGKAVKGFSSDVNWYSSPLEKIWELELVK